MKLYHKHVLIGESRKFVVHTGMDLRLLPRHQSVRSCAQAHLCGAQIGHEHRVRNVAKSLVASVVILVRFVGTLVQSKEDLSMSCYLCFAVCEPKRCSLHGGYKD
jgi:hypothetical protein